MSTNKQALREAAEKAISEEGETWWNEDQLASDYGLALHRPDAKFIAAANPATVLALLDELEAAEKRIAELSESHSKLRETMAAIHNTIKQDGFATPLAVIMQNAKRAHEESAAAGITVKGE